jgi:hypothetical protein
MDSFLSKHLARTGVAVAVIGALAGAATYSTPAEAWWRADVVVTAPFVVARPVVVAPPVLPVAPAPFVVAPPVVAPPIVARPVVVRPRLVWIPGHRNGPYWVRGHWGHWA